MYCAHVPVVGAVTLSFVDRHGLRHQIDFESWISWCAQWVVKNMSEDRSGVIEHRVSQRTYNPVHTLGGHQVHYVGGTTTVTDEEATYSPSEEPITCLMCIANATGP